MGIKRMIKKFDCEHCGRKFARKGNRTKHILEKHVKGQIPGLVGPTKGMDETSDLVAYQKDKKEVLDTKVKFCYNCGARQPVGIIFEDK